MASNITPTPPAGRMPRRAKRQPRASRQFTTGSMPGYQMPTRQMYLSQSLINYRAQLSTENMRNLIGWGIPGICGSTLMHQVEGLDWKILNPKKQADDITAYFTDLIWSANDGLGGDNTFFNKLIEDVLACRTGGFVEIVRNFDGIPTALYSVDGATVWPTLEPEAPFEQKFHGQTVTTFSAFDLLQVVWRPFTDWQLLGYNRTPLQIAWDAINVLGIADDYIRRALSEDIPAGLLNLGPNFDRNAALDWKTTWDAMMASDVRVNKFGILWGADHIDFAKFAFNPQEMQVSQTTLWETQLVTAAFELTPADIGLNIGGAGGNAGEQQVTLTKRRGLRALIEKIERAFTRLVLPPGYELEFDAIDTSDERDIAAIAQMKSQSIAQYIGAMGPVGIKEALAAGVISDPDTIEEAMTWVGQERELAQQQQQAEMDLKQQAQDAKNEKAASDETAQDTNPKRDYGSRQPKRAKGES